MELFQRIEQAKRELEQARQDFEWATGPFVTVAALRLKAAEIKWTQLTEQAKRIVVTV